MKGKGERKENQITRINPKFNEELIDIQKQRKENGLDKTHTSINDITSLIPRHNSWPLIKKEIVEYNFNDE
jgi:hypothetical protein